MEHLDDQVVILQNKNGEYQRRDPERKKFVSTILISPRVVQKCTNHFKKITAEINGIFLIKLALKIIKL